MTSPLEQRLQGSWKMLRGRIRETFGRRENRAKGMLEQLMGALEFRTGQTRAEIRRKLNRMYWK